MLRPRGRRPDPRRARLAAGARVHDPGIGFVTLTRVQVSPTCSWRGSSTRRSATTRRAPTSARALERAAPFLRRQIGARLRLKRTPELTFIYDDSIAGQDRIEQILQRAACRPAAPRRCRTHDRVTYRRTHCAHRRRRSAARQRFVHLVARAAGRRLHRLAAGDGLRPPRARQGRATSSTRTRRRRRCWQFPGVDGDRDRRPRRRGLRRRHHHGVRRPRPHRRRRPRAVLRHQHRSPSRATRLRRAELVRRVRGRLRRDGVRSGRRARRAADARDRHPRLPRDPHRHRVVPLLEHLAADVRHLPPDARGRRRSGACGAQRLRQQQHGPAEAVRRGAERDAARPHRAGSPSSISITRWRARRAAPTRTPRA